jgi:hypothetical protein
MWLRSTKYDCSGTSMIVPVIDNELFSIVIVTFPILELLMSRESVLFLQFQISCYYYY